MNFKNSLERTVKHTHTDYNEYQFRFFFAHHKMNYMYDVYAGDTLVVRKICHKNVKNIVYNYQNGGYHCRVPKYSIILVYSQFDAKRIQ